MAIDAFQAQPFRLGDAVLQIAVKAGVSLFPDDGTDAESLLRNAESALKTSKGSGDRYVFYAARMAEMVSGRLNPEGLSLVSTIINLGHSLKLKVVAEGVESDEQSHLLRLLNSDEAQGFHFSRPLPREVFETEFLAPLSARKQPPAGTCPRIDSSRSTPYA